MPEAPDVDATVRQIERLLEELGEADPPLRKRTEEVVRLLMQLYGAGFGRALEMLGPEAAGRLADDKLLSSLLLLHGLHPADAATRIGEALGRLERRLDGPRLALIEIDNDVARVEVKSTGGAPPSLAGAIERAIAECAPEIAAVKIEGLPRPTPALVQIAPAVSC